mmetsp:Transcript_35899/g.41929  ORF Transcript_35899/g.41929 Transcript_35899/m.41929 type:complete len:301 (+) Transcript_35899:14-916(+)
MKIVSIGNSQDIVQFPARSSQATGKTKLRSRRRSLSPLRYEGMITKPSGFAEYKYQGKPVLVLDLDETLIHATRTRPSYPAQEITVVVGDRKRRFYVVKRPGVEEFLETLAQSYTILIYTASIYAYAETILLQLGLKRFIAEIYHREHCLRLTDELIIKDLSVIGKNIDRMVLIDDAVHNMKQQPENSLLISRFEGAESDCWLATITPFLKKLALCHNFRSVSRKFDLFLLGHDILEESDNKPMKMFKKYASNSEKITMMHKFVDDESCLDDETDEGLTSIAQGEIMKRGSSGAFNGRSK